MCVDGPAGSGKTTLAGALGPALDAPTPIHMDDLYDGWDQDLGEPLAKRVHAWLLRPWAVGRAGRFRRFDWDRGQFDEVWVPAPPASAVVVEGCASASRGIRAVASVVVWVTAPPDLRLRRGLERDGRELADQLRAWQVKEAAHFMVDGTRAAADVVVDGRTGRLAG